MCVRALEGLLCCNNQSNNKANFNAFLSPSVNKPASAANTQPCCGRLLTLQGSVQVGQSRGCQQITAASTTSSVLTACGSLYPCRGMVNANGDPFLDYPYAEDGLRIWKAMQTYFTDYCKHYYGSGAEGDAQVVKDTELQAWWKDVTVRLPQALEGSCRGGVVVRCAEALHHGSCTQDIRM